MTWIAELGQHPSEANISWLEQRPAAPQIWDLKRAGLFLVTNSLSCLGATQFGRNRHNVCLRGDIACMRPQLAKDFVAPRNVSGW